ncbi:transcription factor S-II (TFIIS)and transcription factor S-II (TFIIS) central domain containing protein, putative [Babesia bigemina]|uniref:Transcription factor S-II (TFIIS)and transcription factor S-II (TFIIS) central domain containing protein, putative n=1 Tax=Babesia bigemina TaxID=5866 RepID=A0A061DC92_BABBI|nr:transcription factor S-II (TFIIS)and transcription factor S-II (TFIIS) central domain containing protein, putative [Babesia bigemina]CDR95410.1 transcription factor S-II (TFIIS)and transcription factor S-II (TFIIS) central domain containing protein, putative [Babesia bigemina]|eukprot:XP_012767596.1 transcription factor S-II (TFIIS)and transcription factor S-II (TFIIS) central domain containing protein, putative [Babesia bigemina]
MEYGQEILKIRQRIEEFVPNILDKAPSEEEVKELLGHLRKLEDVKVDRTLLQNTRIGAALTKLAKSPSKDIDVLKDTAVKLTSKWKDTLRQQGSSKENADDAPLKRQKTEPADGNADSLPKYQYLLHNQDIRDKALVYIFNAFTAVPGSGYDYKKVSKLAYDVECGLFDKYLVNQSNQKEYTLKLKSIAFNLRDPKNATFRNKIYNGDIDANKVAAMESAEMASDEKKMERINILQESLEACQSDWAVKNILMSKDGKKKGQFKCFKCNSSETVYHQLQTRSSDEPMTTFVTCLQCNNRWKF